MSYEYISFTLILVHPSAGRTNQFVFDNVQYGLLPSPLSATIRTHFEYTDHLFVSFGFPAHSILRVYFHYISYAIDLYVTVPCTPRSHCCRSCRKVTLRVANGSGAMKRTRRSDPGANTLAVRDDANDIDGCFFG